VTRSDRKHLDAIEKLTGQKIEWLDGDLASLGSEDTTEEAPRRGRGGDRKRGEAKGDGARKGRGRSRKSEEDAPVAADEEVAVSTEAAPEPVAAEATVEAVRTPRPERGRQRASTGRDEDRRSRRERDDEPTPVGFGDDVPAFMRIVVKV
jgi:hypothetical protein